MVPDVLGGAWRPVAVEVTELTIDFIQVPLLWMEVGVGGGMKDKIEKVMKIKIRKKVGKEEEQ